MRRPPTFMPGRPCVQPLRRPVSPLSAVSKGLSRSHDESNCLPVEQAMPMYCTSIVSPSAASAPVPTLRSFVTSFLGGSWPAGISTIGLPVFFGTPVAALHFMPAASTGTDNVGMAGLSFAADASLTAVPSSPQATRRRTVIAVRAKARAVHLGRDIGPRPYRSDLRALASP